MAHERRQGEAGFTLIEILIALMIAGFGLAALSGLMSSGFSLSDTSGRVGRETMLARSALERFGTVLDITPDVRVEELAESYWLRSEVRLADPQASPDTIRMAVITVTVWNKRADDPGVRLTTLRLQPPRREGAL